MQTEAKEIQRTLKDPKFLNGVWKLTYRLSNRLDKAGFSGRNLTTYPDALSGTQRPLYNLEGVPTVGYMISKPVTFFHPDKDLNDRNKLDWLIGHPEISVPQKHAGLTDRHMAKKNSNPRITLINMDYEEVEDLEDEDFVDKLVGQISLDNGTQAISHEKLRFILSSLNKAYFEMKYINNKTVEKKKLRKSLKDFVRSSKANAEKVYSILENLDNAKYGYQIKEMVRLGVLNIGGGMYKRESNPLATSVDGVIKYFLNSPDYYAELQKELYQELKKESNNAK